MPGRKERTYRRPTQTARTADNKVVVMEREVEVIGVGTSQLQAGDNDCAELLSWRYCGLMTACRIWRTRIDQSEADEYRRFADLESLPMFRSHDGFLGVVFAERGDERVVITFWRDDAAVAALNNSPRYREAVQGIEATGFILGPSSVEVFEVHDAAIDASLV
jgi:heme-degrading monooxygenase HmoA